MTTRRLVPVFALTTATALLIAATTLASGCSEAPPEQQDLSAELRALSKSIEGSNDAVAELATEVKRQNRRIDGLSRRVGALGLTPAMTAAHGQATAGSSVEEIDGALPAAGMPASGEIAKEVAAVLATEAGRKAVAAATRGAIAENNAKQRDTFVAYSLSSFAKEARLTETQNTDMRKVWGDVMDDARAMMRDAAPKKGMTPEERAESVQKIRTGMRDLGQQREERMRSILDDSQFELYKERQKEIDAGLHSAPGQGGRRGGGARPDGAGTGDAPQR